ncbi:MAG: YdbH domain-containing protein, partial [Candidatus Omnitrophica bacterium]|nr:YdbH domain-containing protein [Candidatus Omnitrophota bacterium]
ACFIFVLVFIFISPLIAILAKKQLENVFIKSQVSIGRCVFQPTAGLIFFNIEIKKTGVYDIKVKEASIQYGLKLSLKGPTVYVSIPKKPIRELAGHIKAGQGAPIFKSVEVSGLALDLHTLDLNAKAGLDLELNLITQSLDYLNLKMKSFSMFGVELENVLLEFGPGSKDGRFSIPLLKYDLLNVSDIRGNIKLRDKLLSAYGVSAKALNGAIELDLGLEINKSAGYLAEIKCVNLDIEKFVRDFNLGEKFDMTGRLSGGLKLKGKACRIEILDGSFSTPPPGGMLVIKDTKFLENMGRATNQPVSLLVESFKNYRYNIGSMSLGFQGGSIVLGIKMEGEAGKRSFNVILHDFKLGRGGS